MRFGMMRWLEPDWMPDMVAAAAGVEGVGRLVCATRRGLVRLVRRGHPALLALRCAQLSQAEVPGIACLRRAAGVSLFALRLLGLSEAVQSLRELVLFSSARRERN